MNLTPSCIARFWSKVEVGTDTSCWPWKASKTSNGYGKFGLYGRGAGWAYAHRVAVWLARGEIPPGLQVDHLCRVRDCVNPAHLDLVTARTNMRRQPRSVSQTCFRGHAYEGLVDDRGRRICRDCQQIRERRRTRRLLRAAGHGDPTREAA